MLFDKAMTFVVVIVSHAYLAEVYKTYIALTPCPLKAVLPIITLIEKSYQVTQTKRINTYTREKASCCICIKSETEPETSTKTNPENIITYFVAL